MMNNSKSIVDQLRSKFGATIRVGDGCDLALDTCVEIDEGGFLSIGDRVSIRRGTTIQVHRDATIVIGNDVTVGENTFISAMVGIRIGDGVGISNMVDFHDHNHRERSHVRTSSLTPWASGFVGAPIIVQAGAVISNKVSVTAGVRIGQNSIVGANSVVTRSLGPNTVAVGVPARPIRTFDSAYAAADDRQLLRVAWFGTSIMEHLEAYNAQMFTQATLPNLGSSVTVEAWRKGGYVQQIYLNLQVGWPSIRFAFDNDGESGATSRMFFEPSVTQLKIAQVLPIWRSSGCGINDGWREFEGRKTEAVEPDEFSANYL